MKNKKTQLTEQEMLHRAAAYCSMGERCRQDVEKKIFSAGLSPDIAKRILDRLEKEKFIDEGRFCQSFVNDKLRFNKWGRIRIALELKKKGIPSTLYYEALEAIDEELYMEILRGLLNDKKRTVKAKDRRDEYYKLLRFAAGKGFETEFIAKCLRNPIPDEDIYPDTMD